MFNNTFLDKSYDGIFRFVLFKKYSISEDVIFGKVLQQGTICPKIAKYYNDGTISIGTSLDVSGDWRIIIGFESASYNEKEYKDFLSEPYIKSAFFSSGAYEKKITNNIKLNKNKISPNSLDKEYIIDAESNLSLPIALVDNKMIYIMKDDTYSIVYGLTEKKSDIIAYTNLSSLIYVKKYGNTITIETDIMNSISVQSESSNIIVSPFGNITADDTKTINEYRILKTFLNGNIVFQNNGSYESIHNDINSVTLNKINTSFSSINGDPISIIDDSYFKNMYVNNKNYSFYTRKYLIPHTGTFTITGITIPVDIYVCKSNGETSKVCLVEDEQSGVSSYQLDNGKFVNSYLINISQNDIFYISFYIHSQIYDGTYSAFFNEYTNGILNNIFDFNIIKIPEPNNNTKVIACDSEVTINAGLIVDIYGDFFMDSIKYENKFWKTYKFSSDTIIIPDTYVLLNNITNCSASTPVISPYNSPVFNKNCFGILLHIEPLADGVMNLFGYDIHTSIGHIDINGIGYDIGTSALVGATIKDDNVYVIINSKKILIGEVININCNIDSNSNFILLNGKYYTLPFYGSEDIANALDIFLH